MTVREQVSLAPLTTLGVGGSARYFADVENEAQLAEAVAFARAKEVPTRVLGAGSNVLVSDHEINALVLRYRDTNLSFEDEGDTTLVRVGAGLAWEELVDACATRGLWGIENLAGIPGLVGGAFVQNIGAYGTEFARVVRDARVYNLSTDRAETITRADLHFGYRTSLFRENTALVVLGGTLVLTKKGEPNLSYRDLAHAQGKGVSLSTPLEIVTAVRTIRADKFPPLGVGSAGSFFKNPVVSSEVATSLQAQYPDLPLFPQENGSVKLSLAWLLDHALFLKGYREGRVRLYEKQPLVVVADKGATATEVDAFAQSVASRVLRELQITIEREVETIE